MKNIYIPMRLVKKGDKVDTYVKLLQHNIDIIYDGLKGE